MTDAEESQAVKAWLRELREAAGLSQQNLADLVGVDRRTILNAESAKTGFPEGLTLLRILRVLGAVPAAAAAPTSDPLRELRDEVREASASAGDSLIALRLALEGIGAALARIEARLPGEDGQAQEARN